MRRALSFLTLVAFLGGCKATPIPGDQLTIDEEEFILAVNDDLVAYEKSRKAGLIEDQRTHQHRLTRTADERREVLVKALHCNDYKGRMVAAATLGFSANDDVLVLLIDALADSDSTVRHHALWGLAVHGSDQTPVNPIVAQLNDPDAEIRVNALGALSKVLRRGNDKGAMSAILERLGDADWRVRGQAVLAIAAVGRKDSIPILVEKPLKDDAAEVRLDAVGALFVIADPKSIDPLIGALVDADQRVADTAERALEQLTGQKFGKEPAKWQTWWTNRQALGMGLDH